jgi:hypothetical protein
MQTNVNGRLKRFNFEFMMEPFRHHHSTDNFIISFVGEHAGKFLDAACRALEYQDNRELRSLADRVAAGLVAAQERDGYLGTYTPQRRWTVWDVWVHKYDLLGLLAYYQLTSSERALGAAMAVGDLLDRTFGDEPGKRQLVFDAVAPERQPIGGGIPNTSVLDTMVSLYRYTSNPRYLAFAKFTARSMAIPQGHNLIGHLRDTGSIAGVPSNAYTSMTNLNGLCDLYELTGEKQWLEPVLIAWEDIKQHQVYPTGAISAGENFGGLGLLPSLPASSVGETCATVTWLELTARLFALTLDTRYGAEIERAVHNHLFAAQDPANGDFCYYTAYAGLKPFSHAPLCCVSSGPRAIAMLPEWTWGTAGDDFVVNLYTPGAVSISVAGTPVHIRCDTDFPASGRVYYTVSCRRSVKFAVRFRVPDWCESFVARVGDRQFVGRRGEWLSLDRLWTAGDRVEVDMALSVSQIDGAPTYPDFVGLRRGPEVLTVERSANSALASVGRVALPHGNMTSLSPAPASTTDARAYTLAAEVSTDSGAVESREVVLVPFADARDHCVWLRKAGMLPSEPPPATLFARVATSHFGGPIEAGGRPGNEYEFLTDERSSTALVIDNRGELVANLLPIYRESRPSPPEEVWIALLLDSPTELQRVVFSHGELGPSGGWFDAESGPPRLEMLTNPALQWSQDVAALDQKLDWLPVGTFDDYPAASAGASPGSRLFRNFELRLQQPISAHAIRLRGQPAGHYVTLAGLHAYAV